MRKHALTAVLAGLCAVPAFADAPSVEERVREAVGEGGVDTLRMIEQRNPALHKRIKRFMALAFGEFGGKGFLRGRAKELLADPKAREVLVRNLDARHRAKELLRRYDESAGAQKDALKPKVKEAVTECYEARLAAQELRLAMLTKRLKEAREKKDEKIARVVAALTEGE